ncbi:MAG: sigma-70 family RNA polymerase sigma factor [Methylovulum sp.]|nr:sigma-70 family RNA polymerase sigma factor [Methylovulum sp.]
MNGTSGTDRDDLMDTYLADRQDHEAIGSTAFALCSGLSMPDEPHLQALIERIIDQDQRAFAALYEQLLERVYGLALRITRHAPLAEEVTEDVFWQVWRQAPRFDAQRGSVVAWVMTIARSRALDALRRSDMRGEEVADDAAATVFLAGGNPQDLLAAVEENSCIHTALQQLAPLPRQLVALAFFRGLSHDEIALHMDLPLGTVKSHIRRALLSLKQTLAVTADY